MSFIRLVIVFQNIKLQDLTVWYSITADGQFLKKTVKEVIQKKEFLTVPFMTGVTDHEFSWILKAVSA